MRRPEQLEGCAGSSPESAVLRNRERSEPRKYGCDQELRRSTGFALLARGLLAAADQAVAFGGGEAAPDAVAGAGLECVLEALLAHRAGRADRLGLIGLGFGHRE